MIKSDNRLRILFLVTLCGLLLSFLVGCKANQDVPVAPVLTKVSTGTIKVIGPFSKQGDRIIIHALSVYEEDAEQIVDGKGALIGSAYVSWNDEIVFALNSSEGTLDFIQHLEPIPTYDYVSYRGYCHRESNGLISLVFAGNYSGTVNASRPDDLFYVYYDHTSNKVRYEEVTEGFINTQGCVDSINSYRDLNADVITAEKALIATLSPLKPENSDNSDLSGLQVSALNNDPRSLIQTHFTQFSEYYTLPECAVKQEEEIFDRGCLQVNSQFSLVAKHPHYAIYRLELIRDCDSSGVDLLHIAETDSWYHLYSIPSGCSKHFLYYPEYTELSADKITMNLCTYCLHWGTWEAFEFDLRSKVIKGAVK